MKKKNDALWNLLMHWASHQLSSLPASNEVLTLHSALLIQFGEVLTLHPPLPVPEDILKKLDVSKENKNSFVYMQPADIYLTSFTGLRLAL